MVKELLSELYLQVVLKFGCIVIQGLLPEEVERGMVLDCIVGRSKEGAAVQPVEGWDELRALKKLDEGLVIRVLVERIKERERLRRRGRLLQRELSGRNEGQKGEEADGYARPRPHGWSRAEEESVQRSSKRGYIR